MKKIFKIVFLVIIAILFFTVGILIMAIPDNKIAFIFGIILILISIYLKIFLP